MRVPARRALVIIHWLNNRLGGRRWALRQRRFERQGAMTPDVWVYIGDDYTWPRK